jgi:hypothetical protein
MVFLFHWLFVFENMNRRGFCKSSRHYVATYQDSYIHSVFIIKYSTFLASVPTSTGETRECVRVRACIHTYEGVCRSFRTGSLEQELQMVQLSATRCKCIVILWFSLVSFTAVTLCFASQRVFIVVYFVIDPFRKLLDTSSYISIYLPVRLQ